MNFSTLSQYLPLIQQIGTYIKLAADHYSDLRVAGKVADADTVALFLLAKMSNWNPVFNGKEVLDQPTKAAAARFIAGVAINFIQ